MSCARSARAVRNPAAASTPADAAAQPAAHGAPAQAMTEWKPATDRDQFFYDLSLAALERTRHAVTYDPAYVTLDYPGGDVPDNTGACADVVVRAYRALNIDLQVDVHEDMKANFKLYSKRWGLKRPDKNIDHRRVLNLMTLFSRKGKKLPITDNPADYQPGHIVSWDLNGKGLTHIGIVTHIRSTDGKRFLLVHNIGRGPRLEDVLFDWKIIGHHTYFGARKFDAEGNSIQ
jgi:hypothetical protein